MLKINKIFILIGIFLLSSSLIIGQKLELKVQDYHSDQITNLSFSTDARFLATTSKDKTIRIWDLRTGLLYNSLNGFLFGVNSVNFTSDGKYLISNGDIMDKKLWDFHIGKEIDFYKKQFQYNTYVRSLAIDPKSNQLLVAFKSGNLQSWNLKTETKNFEVLIDQNERIDIGFSNESDEFYVISPSAVFFYSKSNGVLKRKLINSLNSTKKFAINLTQSVSAFGSADGQIKIIPFGNSTIKSNTFIGIKNEVSDLFFSNSGKYLIASYGLNNYYVWDIKSQKRILDGVRIYDLDFSNDDSLIVCASKQFGFFYQDIEGNKNFKISNLKCGFDSKVLINPKFNLLVFVDESNNLIYYDYLESNLVRKREIKIDLPIYSQFINNNLLIINSEGALFKFNFQELKGEALCANIFSLNDKLIEFDNKLYSTNKEVIKCLPKIEFRQLSHNIQLHKKLNKGILIYESDEIKYLNNDKSEVLYQYSSNSIVDFDYDEVNKILGILDSKSVIFYNLESNKIIKKIPQPQTKYIKLKFVKENKAVLLLDELKALKKINYETKKNLFTIKDPSGLTTYSMEDSYQNFIEYDYRNNIAYFMGEEFKILGVDVETGEIIKEFKGHNGRIANIQFDTNNSFLISNSLDGTVKLWDLGSSNLIATLIFSGNNWIIFNPDNQYSFNKNGHGLVGFKLGEKISTFESFDLIYNRPDRLLTQLKAKNEIIDLYKIAFNKRIKKLALDSNGLVGEKLLPKVSILNSQNIPLNSKVENIEINIFSKDSLFNLKQIVVSVNGCQVYNFNPNAKTFSKKVSIKLNSGKNLIKVYSINSKGLSSLPEVLNINYKIENLIKPNLYLFIVGVSEYSDKKHNLKYAVKDGIDIIETFKNQKDQYNKIIIDTLFNKNANKANFLKSTKKFSTIGINDVLIFSFSGHGLLNDDFDFYFASYDVDFNSPEKNGLSYDLIESVLKSSPARKKLLLIDACHSGEVEKEIQVKLKSSKNNLDTNKTISSKGFNFLDDESIGIDPFHLMQQIFVSSSFNSGIVSITASTGNSFALEADAWQNGAFTHSLLKLLNSYYNSVTISEFKSQLEKSVIDLTNGKQQPTSRSENLEFDWVIWY